MPGNLGCKRGLRVQIACVVCAAQMMIHPCRKGKIKTCSPRCRSLYFSKMFLRKDGTRWGGQKPKTSEEIKRYLLSVRRIGEKGECWEWPGVLNNHGYGKICYKGKQRYVHKVAAHLFLGLPFEGKIFILHRCDNPKCFNPDHLFAGSQADNIQDAIKKGRFRSIREVLGRI